MVNSVDGNFLTANTGIKQNNVQHKIEKSKDVAVDRFENNTVIKSGMNSVADEDNKKDVILMFPFVYYLNKFADNLIAGKKANSGLLNKVADAGDNISRLFKLDKLFSSENVGKVSKGVKENTFTKYFTENYAAVPKSAFAKSESMAATYSEEKLKEPAEKLLSNLASRAYTDSSILSSKGNLSKATLKLLKGLSPDLTDDYLAKVSASVSELASQNLSDADKKALEILQKSLEEYISGGKLPENSAKLFSGISSTLGRYADSDVLKTLSSDTSSFISGLKKNYSPKQILNAADDLASNGIKLNEYTKILELRNKIKAANNQTGETLLGKFLSKGVLKIKDTLTFNGGDVLSLLFTASALVQAIKAAKEAPKGEKKSTFMHVLSENYVGFILLKPSSKLLYSAAGNKYRGMDEAGRKALKELVKSANANQNLTKEGLKLANLQKKLLLKGVDADKVSALANMSLKEAKAQAKKLAKGKVKIKLWERPLKMFGKVLATGLDDIKRHKLVKLPVLGEKMLPHPTLKGFLGGFGRALLIMMVIQPFLQKPVTKLVHKIFGEPKTYLEKEKEKQKEDAQKTPGKTVNPDSTVADNQDTNLINRYINSQNNMNNPQVNDCQPSNNREIQSSIPSDNDENVLPSVKLFDKNSDKTGRYIPSIQVQYDNQKEKELEKYAEGILQKTDKMVEKINNSLK